MTTVKEQVQRLVGQAPPTEAGNLYLLAELSQEFALSLDVEETLRNAVATIIRFLDAEAASVFLLDGQELVCRASAGPAPITGMRLPPGRGILGRTLATNMCQMVRDVRADPDFNTAVDRSTGFVTRSIMCTPLQVQKRPLGVLQVLNKNGEPGLFSEQDLYVLRVLGVSVSLAIHNARMAADLVEQKRHRQELELARQLQQRLLPEPRPAGFPLIGINIPAYEVSGDFFDYFDLGDGRIGFTIGDVSGKGLNAALLMVRSTSLLRGLGRAENSLPMLLRRVNAELYETSSRGMFVSALAGVYDPAKRAVAWCSAGFPAVLHQRKTGGFERYGAEAPPLGVLAEPEFPLQRAQLAPGEALYFYTDGATEVRQADVSLDEAGLQALIAEHAPLPPAERLKALMDRLRKLRLRDDTTLLLLEDRRDSRELLSLEIPAVAEKLSEMRAAVSQALRDAGLTGAQSEPLVLALDEACTNVIRYAYRGAAGTMHLGINAIGHRFEFRLRDHAEAVDPRQLKAKPLDPARPGGLGLRFIDSIMDSRELRSPEDGPGNLLVMTKTIR